MIICQKRVQNIERVLPLSQFKGKKVSFYINGIERFSKILQNIGFSTNFSEGEVVLPTPIGPVSTRNADGKYIVHRDQPLETAYRQVEWHWEEFHGPYDRIPQSKIVDVPYERYPRTYIDPQSIELTIVTNTNGEKIINAPDCEYNIENQNLVRHTINLFLEIFGECTLLFDHEKEIIHVPVRRLNWKILPQGKRPWAQLKPDIEKVIDSAPKGNQLVIEHRLFEINKHGPEFTAIGEAGFRGYIIFGFPEKSLYMLESINYGNATYVFEDKWEELSKKTKAEILNNNYQKARVIHRDGWEDSLDDIFNQNLKKV
jgi:hypothetical protein